MTSTLIPEQETYSSVTVRKSLAGRPAITFAVMIGLIAAGVVRSSIATRLDDFTIDEAYHITSGVSYVRTGDYRLNPEHPPLVKLWAGAVLALDGFQLAPFRELHDKNDERDFTDTAVYQINDPDRVQSRARAAMFALNSLLLFFFAFAARHVFGDTLALAALAFLVIDPTVAAHMPVVMTDLPVSLLSATAMLFAAAAFRTWRACDLLLTSLFLGLALAAKHSGLLAAAAITAFACAMVIARTSVREMPRARRLGMTSLVLFGAFIVLWSFYRMRFEESNEGHDLFNRPLAAKVADVQSPLFRSAMGVMLSCHLLPRAYVWGLADTIRSGVEGRAYTFFAFGRMYYRKAPAYFFPGVLAVKLPLGLIALTLAGAALIVMRRLPAGWLLPITGMIGLASMFLAVLVFASPYAGVRHVLPVFPPLALIGAVVIDRAVRRRSLALCLFASLAITAALTSAFFIMRPWEYYNEVVGGASNAYRYFNDEGIDLSQRRFEIFRYYDERLRASGEAPYMFYNMSKQEMKRRGIHWKGEYPDERRAEDKSNVISGTFFVEAARLAPRPWWDHAAFREAEPAARFGNLFVFSGTFHLPWLRAQRLYRAALNSIYSEHLDATEAERQLSESVDLDPQCFYAAIELGNLLARRGARDEAVRAFDVARSHAPPGDEIIDRLTRQIERITNEPPESVPPLRNPSLE